VSLRARLLIGTAVIVLVLAVAAVAIARTTERHLVDQVDEQLRSASGQTRLGPGRPGQGEEGTGPRRLSSLYIGVLDDEDVLVTAFAPNLTADDAPVPELTAHDIEALRDGRPLTVGSEDSNVQYRMLARDAPNGVTLVLALPLDGVQDTVNRLIAVELLAVVALLAVLALVMWWVIRLGVRPVQRMTETASAIAGGDLSRRVPEGAAGTEAGELGVALNAMLGRIEEAFDQRAASEARLRQFVADASHELRTPVTTIRGYAELYRTGGLGQPTDLDEAMRRTEQEALRMGSLVDDLLHLARLDQGRPLEREPVDLTQLAADAVRDARAVQPDCAITAIAPEPVAVIGDESRLRQVIANLVANALVHAPGAPIEVRVHRSGDGAIVEVADEGPGMAEADAGRAFERFYRADASRARHQGGSGLGLSIVDATVRAHGGTVSLTTAPDEGTTVHLELPSRSAVEH